VLVIGNLHDPATPYQGALDLARTLGNAQVLTWNGEGHTSYLHGSSCIDQHVDTYLVTGRLPPRGLTCPR
jgi:pimeloyl-ACP methyl ester carboxylesterase